jgi:hypothetical protein
MHCMRCNIYNVKLHYIEFFICIFNLIQCKGRWLVITEDSARKQGYLAWNEYEYTEEWMKGQEKGSKSLF